MTNSTQSFVELDTGSEMDNWLRPSASQTIATSVLAPAFSGWCLQLLLTGVALSNASEYYRLGLYSRDPRHLRLVIISVLVLLLWCSGFSIYEILRWGVSQNRSAEAIGATSRVDALLPLPGALLGFLVQGVLLKRAYSLFDRIKTKRIWLAATGLVMAISTFGALETVVMGFYFNTGNVEDALPFTYSQAIATWLWPAMLLDVTITITLCILTIRRIEGFNDKMDSVLARLARLSVETALPTALIATAGAVVSSSFPSNDLLTLCIPFAFWLPLPSLYAISLFATLSARDRLRAILQQAHVSPQLDCKPETSHGSPTEPSNRRPHLKRIVSLAFSRPFSASDRGAGGSGLGDWRRQLSAGELDSFPKSVGGNGNGTGSRVSEVRVEVSVEQTVEVEEEREKSMSDAELAAAEAGYARRGSAIQRGEPGWADWE